MFNKLSEQWKPIAEWPANAATLTDLSDYTADEIRLSDTDRGSGIVINAGSVDITSDTAVNIFSTVLNLSQLPEYEDNAAATTGGLRNGDLYRTPDKIVMIVVTA